MSTPEYNELEPEFGEVMAILRGGLPEMPTEQPTEAVWDAITAELGPTVAGSPSSAGDRSSVPSAPSVAASDDGALAEVRSITSARSWARPLAMVAGAAAALLVGVPLFLAVTGGTDPSQRAELAALEGFDGSGEAEVAGSELSVRFDGADAPEGSFYELWLLDLEGDELEDLVSLGQVEVAADGSFVIPEGIDLGEFDVVDVSVEPDDGNPDHSGVSILRGGLTDL